MLKLEMLPARHGDCLWLEWGDPSAPKRLLIDGGAPGTYKRALRPKMEALPPDQRRFELLVVTHIDSDHIAGILDLLTDAEVGFAADDIWFNGYRHLPDEAPDTLGPVQGERLTDLLVSPNLPWNTRLDGGAVAIPEQGELPRFELEGGLVLTLLSPKLEDLANLKPKWKAEIEKAGLDPNRTPPQQKTAAGFQLLSGSIDVDALSSKPFEEDESEANGSSIALLAEYEGKRLLLAGDAWPRRVRESIRRIGGDDVFPVDALKLSHHGSKSNTSPALLRAIDCPTYLFSTSGSYFGHPSPEMVARVIKIGGQEPTVVFNYRTEHNAMWAAPQLKERYGYDAEYPDQESGGKSVAWE